jgi:hypothetical protein
MMSHYFCHRLSFGSTAQALAVLALSGRVSPCTAAGPLIAGSRLAQLLPAVQVLTAAQAVRLTPVARAADPDAAPTASAVKLPIGSLHPRPPQHWTAPGEAGI